jgi:hypothetical protein
MEFDHKHYVPILKGKRAEFAALGTLQSAGAISPLFEAVPSQGADFVPRRMGDIWSKDQAYFVDLIFMDDLDDATVPANTTHPVAICFAEVRKHGQLAIPVAGLSRSPGYQDAVKQVVKEQGNGLALRLTSDDFEDADELGLALTAACTYFGLEEDQIDLVLDLQSVASSSAGTIAQMHRANIELLPNIPAWRTLTVCASAFPLSLVPLQRNQWNVISRIDWRAWNQIVTGSKAPTRLPAYSDYTIAHPELPPEGQATILAQLRYATPDSWLIWKGRNAIREGFDQFFGICGSLVQRPEFRGPTFSWADGEIAQKATNVGSSGNAQTWRQIGTNHHLETVLEQIANLP